MTVTSSRTDAATPLVPQAPAAVPAVPAATVTFSIDGIETTVPKGTLVIRAAEELGIAIPRFCDHPLLAPVGACRQCLVEVWAPGRDGNLSKMPKPQPSCALEAASLTNKISKLVLYEPPLQDLDHTAIVDRMEKMIQAGDREQAAVTFFQEIVMISPSEVGAMQARPSWATLEASVDSQIRQIRALAGPSAVPEKTTPGMTVAAAD